MFLPNRELVHVRLHLECSLERPLYLYQRSLKIKAADQLKSLFLFDLILYVPSTIFQL